MLGELNEKAGRKTCLFHGDISKIRSFEAEQAQAHKTTIFSGVSMTISRILSHSPSRVVACRLRLLGSVNSRFGLHRLTKRYLIVLSALTHSPDASHLPPRRPPRGHKSFCTIAPYLESYGLEPVTFLVTLCVTNFHLDLVDILIEI